ncbi:aminomethyltransferase family protein, partial [Intrasporangium sp.]|uniref:aminomethyltransferase family protein n=1 Tax=Intrasporangium sp. TaxID=1925024 RepID=UPI00293A6B87
TVYAAHTPGTQLRSARGRLLSPVHDRLVEQGGHLREVSGWEGADWFAGEGQTPEAEPTWGRAPWFEQWEQEHRTVREAVGLMDMSFMAKFRVQGPGAGVLLDRLSAGAVNGDAGVITYTQWLGEDGRIEADLTVTKLDEDDFLVVASDTAHGHVRARLERFADPSVSVTDVTADYAQLNVQGPRSRDLLAELTDTDLSTAAFAFRRARWVELAGVRLLLTRITYAGELGYEVYVPAGDALRVYDAIQASGTAYGLRPVGLKALASLRMEKAYRDYGHDIDNTDCPLEAGLGFALALDKPDFIGRDAVLARKADNVEAGGMARRLVQVRLLDPEPLLFHAELVARDGVPVGYVRAGSYGWTLGSAVGLAMVEGLGQPVTGDWLASGEWEVDVAGTRYPAEVSLTPMYDPTSARVRI